MEIDPLRRQQQFGDGTLFREALELRPYQQTVMTQNMKTSSILKKTGISLPAKLDSLT